MVLTCNSKISKFHSNALNWFLYYHNRNTENTKNIHTRTRTHTRYDFPKGQLTPGDSLISGFTMNWQLLVDRRKEEVNNTRMVAHRCYCNVFKTRVEWGRRAAAADRSTSRHWLTSRRRSREESMLRALPPTIGSVSLEHNDSPHYFITSIKAPGGLCLLIYSIYLFKKNVFSYVYIYMCIYLYIRYTPKPVGVTLLIDHHMTHTSGVSEEMY